MKVAITAEGEDWSSKADPRFGRAKYFIVVDAESGEWTVHDNSQNLQAVQGAGIKAARNVMSLGVEVVITGHVGPKAFATLQAGKIQVYTGAKGSVQQALEQFQSGVLDCASEPNVAGHWQ